MISIIEYRTRIRTFMGGNPRTCRMLNWFGLEQVDGMYDLIVDRLAYGWNVDLVYLEFPKAYDTVDHTQLLKKMKLQEIGSVLL